MPKKTDTQVEREDSILVKAATTIGKSVGRLARLVSRKETQTTQSPTTKKGKTTRKKTSTTTGKKVAAGKTRGTRKMKTAVRSGSPKRKSKSKA
jgi:hypothetical protein